MNETINTRQVFEITAVIIMRNSHSGLLRRLTLYPTELRAPRAPSIFSLSLMSHVILTIVHQFSSRFTNYLRENDGRNSSA